MTLRITHFFILIKCSLDVYQMKALSSNNSIHGIKKKKFSFSDYKWPWMTSNMAFISVSDIIYVWGGFMVRAFKWQWLKEKQKCSILGLFLGSREKNWFVTSSDLIRPQMTSKTHFWLWWHMTGTVSHLQWHQGNKNYLFSCIYLD